MCFRILCYVSAKFFNILNATKLGKTELQEQEPRGDYSDFDDIKGEPAEFEWNIFPGFTTLQLCDKINDLLSSLGQTPEKFTGRILLCLCSMTYPVKERTTDNNAYGTQTM